MIGARRDEGVVPGSASIMQTCDMALPDDIDPRLWVKIKGVDGRCYLFGNNHTFKGRMCAYSEALETDLGVSRGEITASADEAQYWIEGFLAGNEPSEAEALGDDDDDNPGSDLGGGRRCAPTSGVRNRTPPRTCDGAAGLQVPPNNDTAL